MKEVKRCNNNGVKDFTEIKIGFDGIAIANAKDGPNLELTLKDVYLALAKLVPADPKGDTVKPNPHKMWNEVNPNLPEIPIVVIGPPPTSGTRDAFNELAIERGCKKFSGRRALKSKDKNLYKKECRGVREDGPYVEAGENDNLIIEKLVSDPGALGVFGYSFLDQNKDKVKASKIDGVLPKFENISSGKYPVSRSLFFYVKNAHAAVIPGIKEYVKEFTASRTVGADGYLIEKGLIPLPEGERSTFEKDGQTLAKFDSSVLKKK
jgi:phosphate transport system substrate-binding protein